MVAIFEESLCRVIAELLTKYTKWRNANLLTLGEFSRNLPAFSLHINAEMAMMAPT